MNQDPLFVGVVRYTWDDFNEASKLLAKQIRNSDTFKEIDSLYGIPRGGLALTQRLAYLLGLPVVEKSEITEKTLLVDDIADSGHTLKNYLDTSPIKYIAVLFYNLTSEVRPTFFVHLKWIAFPWEENDLEEKIKHLSQL